VENNNVDTTKELPTVIAFCAGYGGIERGLELAGLEHRVIAYVEIEAYAIANLVSKMETGQLPPAPIYTDIKTFPSEIFRDRVDIITGGYPCQPFSAAGKRLGEDDPRHLWPYIRKHVETIRPVQCFFENVEGHISLGLNSVISDLEEDGYSTTWGIFSAREVGAPHQRKRVYIMGDSESNRLSRWAKDSEREGSKNLGERSDQDLRSQSQRSGQALADSRCSASSEGKQQTELRTVRLGESPRGAWSGCGSPQNAKRQAWPSGPGQEQHEWEQPRTVWKTKPLLGGTLDGNRNRVDRLRLLGNAVVPQTAAKAYSVLNERVL